MGIKIQAEQDIQHPWRAVFVMDFNVISVPTCKHNNMLTQSYVPITLSRAVAIILSLAHHVFIGRCRNEPREESESARGTSRRGG